ncbi:MAG: AI-2E family transporter [Armatimonadia bacterium]|nr:AI-2E family transporter [Armatimonadia bacterium]
MVMGTPPNASATRWSTCSSCATIGRRISPMSTPSDGENKAVADDARTDETATEQQGPPEQWSNRRIIFLAVVIALIFYAVFRLPTTINVILGRARDTLILLILSVALTYFLLPVVQYICRIPVRIEPRLKRAIAAGTSVTLFLVLVVLLTTVIVAPIVEETGQVLQSVTDWAQQDLAAQVEAYTERVLNGLPESFRSQVEQQIAAAEQQWTVERITETISERVQDWGKAILQWQVNVISTVLSSGRYLIGLLIVPVFAYYFLTDASTIREGVEAHVPPDARERYHQMLDDIDTVIQRYVHTMLVISLITFVATALTLYFAGVDVYLTFGILAGVSSLVPVLGAIAAVIGITSISLLQVGLKTTVIVMIVYGGIQLVTDRIIAPKLMAEGAELHPVAVLVGLLVGAEFFGMIGIFIAVPVLAAGRVAYVHYRAYMAEGEHSKELDSLLGRSHQCERNDLEALDDSGEPASIVAHGDSDDEADAVADDEATNGDDDAE